MEMTAQEVSAFLDEGRRAYLATNGAEGWPHVVPLSYMLLDGRIAFWTDGGSQKVQNLRRDARATVLVEAGDRVEEFRAVQIRGRAEIIDGYDESRGAGETLFARQSDEPLPPEAIAYVAALANQRVVVKVEPERVVSWDHRKVMVDLQKIGS